MRSAKSLRGDPVRVSKLVGGVATVLLLCTCSHSPAGPVSVGSIAPDAATPLPASAVVGQVLSPTVTVKDASGNALSDFLVLFAVTQGGGSVSPTAASTDATGKATTRWTLGTGAGLQQIDATAGA